MLRSVLIPLLSLFSILLSLQVKAQGDLLIFPKRVVFDGSKRIQILNLSNKGMDSAFYNISFKELRMKEYGGFEKVDQSETSASKYVRIFPRKVVLGPGEVQVVKLQLTRMNQLQPGEYRSHLYFRADPKYDKKEDNVTETEKSESEGFRIELKPSYGITIPVIARKGVSNTKTNFSGLSLIKLEDGKTMLQMNVNRTGNMSVYGNFTVEYISPQGEVKQVGVLNKVAVYTPNATRVFKIALNNQLGIDYSSGKIRVVYVKENPDGVVVLAEAELKLR